MGETSRNGDPLQMGWSREMVSQFWPAGTPLALAYQGEGPASENFGTFRDRSVKFGF